MSRASMFVLAMSGGITGFGISLALAGDVSGALVSFGFGGLLLLVSMLGGGPPSVGKPVEF